MAVFPYFELYNNLNCVLRFNLWLLLVHRLQLLHIVVKHQVNYPWKRIIQSVGSSTAHGIVSLVWSVPHSSWAPSTTHQKYAVSTRTSNKLKFSSYHCLLQLLRWLEEEKLFKNEICGYWSLMYNLKPQKLLSINKQINQLTPRPLVRKQAIPTDRSQLANFCSSSVSRGQRDGFPPPLIADL